MGIKDLPDHVSAAVFKFCQENLEYSGHLSVHGSITVVADTETTITLISKKLILQSENLSDELGEEESHGTGSLEGRSDLSKADDGVAFVTVINNGHEKGVSDSYLESGVSLREAEESDDDQPPDSDTELPLDDTNSKPGFTGSLVHSTPRKSSDSTEGEARQGTTTSSVTQNPFHAAIGIEKHQESSFNQTLARIKPEPGEPGESSTCPFREMEESTSYLPQDTHEPSGTFNAKISKEVLEKIQKTNLEFMLQKRNELSRSMERGDFDASPPEKHSLGIDSIAALVQNLNSTHHNFVEAACLPFRTSPTGGATSSMYAPMRPEVSRSETITAENGAMNLSKTIQTTQSPILSYNRFTVQNPTSLPSAHSQTSAEVGSSMIPGLGFPSPAAPPRVQYSEEEIWRMRMHGGSKDKPFQCDLCQRRFTVKANLTRHLKISHSGIKAFHCTFCGRSFGYKQNLMTHMKRHTGERNFACDICGKSFIRKQQLQMHSFIHIRESHQQGNSEGATSPST